MLKYIRGWFIRIVSTEFTTEVNATRSSVAAGRDIRDNIIQIGLNDNDVGRRIEQAQQPMLDNLAALTAEIARDKGIDPALLRVVLAKLGEHDVPDDAIPNRLIKLADTLNELRERLGTNASDELQPIKANALALLDAGNFSGALAELDRGRLAAQSKRTQSSAREAEFLADQAKILELQISNIAAADKYRQAAALVSDDHRGAFQYLTKQANALQNQGEEFGDNDALRASILIWRSAKQLSPFESDPDDHRKAHNNLGSAIYSLALREPTNQNLLEVEAMNREVLARDSLEREPKYWAAAQANLGSVLLKLGERELGIERLLEALDRLREALATISRDQRPSDWAGIQNNIGNALKLVGERRQSVDDFQESINAYRESLSVLDETMTFQRAMTLVNMASTHSDLGRLLEDKPEPFEQAISELQNALNLTPKDRYPVQWALTKHNIGSARNSLGIVTGDISHYHDSILVNAEALTVHTREYAPLQWAYCQWGIGLALSKIAAKTQNGGEARTAIDILSAANMVIASSDDERAKPGIRGALEEALAIARNL
jgi:tetratricopeptide (TPR) repeat protein